MSTWSEKQIREAYCRRVESQKPSAELLLKTRRAMKDAAHPGKSGFFFRRPALRAIATLAAVFVFIAEALSSCSTLQEMKPAAALRASPHLRLEWVGRAQIFLMPQRNFVRSLRRQRQNKSKRNRLRRQKVRKFQNPQKLRKRRSFTLLWRTLVRGRSRRPPIGFQRERRIWTAVLLRAWNLAPLLKRRGL